MEANDRSKREPSQSEIGEAARIGVIGGGIVGGFAGIIVFGITYGVLKISNFPDEITQSLISKWWYFPAGFALVVGLIAGWYLVRAVQKGWLKSK